MTPPVTTRRLFILIVDKDDTAAQRLALRLRGHGHEVFTARSEEQAERGLLVHPCEVILVDGNLHGDVGGAAKRLRALLRKRPLLVAMTADGGMGAPPDGFDFGIGKPVDTAALNELCASNQRGP